MLRVASRVWHTFCDRIRNRWLNLTLLWKGVLTGGYNDSVWFIKHLALWLDHRPAVIISVAMNLKLNWLPFKEKGLLTCNSGSLPGFISFVMYRRFRIRYRFHASLGLTSPNNHVRQEWFCPVHMCRTWRWGGLPEDLGDGQDPRGGMWREDCEADPVDLAWHTCVMRGSVRSKAIWTWVTSMSEVEHWRKDHNHSGYQWLLSGKCWLSSGNLRRLFGIALQALISALNLWWVFL